jgi:4-hydroxybenzoate polyprenyltransferase
MLFQFVALLRVRQWLKNLMLYFPPFLGGTLHVLVPNLTTLLPFISFCLVSSATYILNDVLDRDNDLHHPDKCTRPIASGQITVTSALFFAAVLLAGSLAIAGNISTTFLGLLIAYSLVSLAYSAVLKEMALVDLFCISSGFMLRLQAGGAAFNVAISGWLFLSVFLLSLFLSAGKRLSEKQRLGDSAADHRKVLIAYPQGFLEGIMYMTGCAVLITYSMYALTRNSQLLYYSVPLCCFGLFRYIFRIRSGKSGDPTESLIMDLPLLIVGLLWICMVGWGIYGG